LARTRPPLPFGLVIQPDFPSPSRSTAIPFFPQGSPPPLHRLSSPVFTLQPRLHGSSPFFFFFFAKRIFSLFFCLSAPCDPFSRHTFLWWSLYFSHSLFHLLFVRLDGSGLVELSPPFILGSPLLERQDAFFPPSCQDPRPGSRVFFLVRVGQSPFSLDFRWIRHFFSSSRWKDNRSLFFSPVKMPCHFRPYVVRGCDQAFPFFYTDRVDSACFFSLLLTKFRRRTSLLHKILP